jgi:NAD(P)H-hydrate epimerase
VLVIGGSEGLTGAVTLAARAASRAGAGYVRVAIPRSLHDVLASKLTEQMPLACAESPSRALAPAAFDRIAEAIARADAVALGPGLSRDPGAAELARRIAAEATKPLVIDADALHALAGASERPASAAPRVLTPHLGEMSRLTGLAPEALEATRIDAPREWSQRWNSVVVMKGAPTVTAAPDGRAVVNPTGNPGMATAGMGDVLTGTIAAWIAQGLAPFDAATLAVYVHGAAGDRIAAVRGMLGLIASDVAEALPLVLKTLEGERVES